MAGESAIAGYAGSQIANKFGPGFFKKLGVRQLPQEKIDALKNKEYPKYYKFLTVVYLIFLLSIPIVGIVFSISSFEKFQHLLYGGGSVYFASKDGAIIFALLTFFALLAIWGGVLGLIFYTLGSAQFKEFLAYGGKNQKSWGTDVIGSMKMFILIGLIYYILVSPLIFFASRNYLAIYPNEIVDNPFFSIQNRTYPLDSIQNVTIKSESNQKNVSILMEALLRDGQTLKWREIDFIGLKKTLKELNIPLIIHEPSGQDLSIVASSCAGIQEDFYTIFELNELTPVNPPGCL